MDWFLRHKHMQPDKAGTVKNPVTCGFELLSVVSI